jgi:hypothetical protein
MLLANLLEFVGSVVVVHVIPDPCEEGLEVWEEKGLGEEEDKGSRVSLRADSREWSTIISM